MVFVSSSVSLASFLLQSFFRKILKTEKEMSTYLHTSVCLQSLKIDCTENKPLEILSKHDLREAFNYGEQGETPLSS